MAAGHLEVFPATGIRLSPDHAGRRPGNQSRATVAGRCDGAAARRAQTQTGKFLATPGRFRLEGPDLFHFSLTPEQTEWLLQILDDVRVGCWVKLGRPELEPAPPKNLTEEEARTMSALELSGFFQTILLGAYDGPEPG